jgi:hypothetical protein
MQSQATVRKGYVAGEFLTRTWRVSGEVEIQSHTLLDQLNDHLALFLQVERIFISPLSDPAQLAGNYAAGNIRKDNLAVVALRQLQAGLPHREGQYMGRDHVDRPLVIVVYGIEVRGVIRLHSSVNVSHFIRTTPEHFIPVFNATATIIAHPEIVFTGGAILLNRGQIEWFCLPEE